jgi:limonene-1,2-epoxide hydrolase
LDQQRIVTKVTFKTPTEVALAYVRLFNRHDAKAIRELYSDDFVAENPRWSEVKNVDDVYASVLEAWETLPGARFEIYNLIAQGPVVVLELAFMWSDDRSVEGEPPNIVERANPVTDVFWVVDGKLTALRAYLDSATMHGWLEEVRKLHRQRSSRQGT